RTKEPSSCRRCSTALPRTSAGGRSPARSWTSRLPDSASVHHSSASDGLGSQPPRMGLLELDHARLRFGGIVALDDVSLEVAEGSIVGLIGPNGAGKTTAFNAITRLYRLDSGDIVFDGRSLRRVRPSRVIRLGIAPPFQNLERFPRMTVLENILVGAHPATRLQREREQRRHALETLADVGIAEHAERPAAGLPYGTLKRVELARALASRPRLL